MATDAGTVELKVKAVDDFNGEPIAFSELSSLSFWPNALITGVVQGLVLAVVLIGAKMLGVL